MRLSYELDSFYKLTKEFYVNVLKDCMDEKKLASQPTDVLEMTKEQLRSFIFSAGTFLEVVFEKGFLCFQFFQAFYVSAASIVWRRAV